MQADKQTIKTLSDTQADFYGQPEFLDSKNVG